MKEASLEVRRRGSVSKNRRRTRKSEFEIDALILGGSTSAMISAYLLSKAKLNVRVVSADIIQIDIPLLISHKVLKELGLLRALSRRCLPIEEIKFELISTDYRGELVSLKVKEVLYLIRWLEFIDVLFERLPVDAKPKFGIGLTGLRYRGDIWELSTQQKTYRARNLIVALDSYPVPERTSFEFLRNQLKQIDSITYDTIGYLSVIKGNLRKGMSKSILYVTLWGRDMISLTIFGSSGIYISYIFKLGKPISEVERHQLVLHHSKDGLTLPHDVKWLEVKLPIRFKSEESMFSQAGVILLGELFEGFTPLFLGNLTDLGYLKKVVELISRGRWTNRQLSEAYNRLVLERNLDLLKLSRLFYSYPLELGEILKSSTSTRQLVRILKGNLQKIDNIFKDDRLRQRVELRSELILSSGSRYAISLAIL